MFPILISLPCPTLAPSLACLVRCRQAWALLTVAALSQIVPGAWMAMMVTNLTKVSSSSSSCCP